MISLPQSPFFLYLALILAFFNRAIAVKTRFVFPFVRLKLFF